MLFLYTMKILDKYILKSFLRPFIATFLIVLFVLVMQTLWQTFENIAGKGISIIFILKFLYYSTLMIIPQALPIGVLLSSIMALGNLGENYEFAWRFMYTNTLYVFFINWCMHLMQCWVI